MLDGFLRIAAATPDIRVADPHYNARQILAQIESAPADTALLVFPELCVTGYTCGDLFLQPSLLRGGGGGAGFSADGNGGGGHRLYRRPACGHGLRSVQLRRRLPKGAAVGAGAQD